MKILVVTQQYWPETWRITDTCERLAASGHDVTVLCGLPNKHDGSLREEYRDKSKWREEHNGVHIIRVYEHPRKSGNLNLYLKYRSFQKNGMRMAKKLPIDFDVVLQNQLSPVLQADVAIKYAKKNNKKILMYCQDLWPESLKVGGIKETGFSGLVFKHYLKVSKRIYNSMNRILVTSPKYVDYLHEVCDVDKTKIRFLPQYGESVFYDGAPAKLDSAREHNFVFAGNVGKAQDLWTLVKAAKLLKERNDIAIHIVGNGSAYRSVIDFAVKEGADNVVFHGRKPLKEIPAIYASADALLVTFSNERLTTYVLPAKLQSYMASSRPIIACANGAVADTINECGCGATVPAGDYEALAKTIAEFADKKTEELASLGRNGFEFSKNYFNPDVYFLTLQEELSSLIN